MKTPFVNFIIQAPGPQQSAYLSAFALSTKFNTIFDQKPDSTRKYINMATSAWGMKQKTHIRMKIKSNNCLGALEKLFCQ